MVVLKVSTLAPKGSHESFEGLGGFRTTYPDGLLRGLPGQCGGWGTGEQLTDFGRGCDGFWTVFWGGRCEFACGFWTEGAVDGVARVLDGCGM